METPGGEGLFDVVIVGAGFAGMYALYRVRQLGLSARVIEAGGEVGGTWYWNRYPGARVDIESQDYSYSFSAELEEVWIWSERFAAQPELLRYASHVADRFDLRRDISFNTRVVALAFDEAQGWEVQLDTGDQLVARFCIMATGCLSVIKESEIPEAGAFAGESHHTGRWPEEPVDFSGKRVAVIGTGSSGIQAITEIAKHAGHLFVIQRTPSFSVPAHNGPTDPDRAAAWKAQREVNRAKARASFLGAAYITRSEKSALQATVEERREVFEDRWRRGGFHMSTAFSDIVTDADANAIAVEFMSEKIRGLVRDPKTAEALIPRSYPFGTRRLCIDTGYYDTFNRENVTLVDALQTPIVAIEPAGIRTSERLLELDLIVHATGFDAMTGALLAIDVRGRDGLTLKERWSDGPATYLGLMVAGFPNLFLVTGPGSPSVLCNMIMAIEQHVDFIADALSMLEREGREMIEASPDAQADWVAHVNAVASTNLLPAANSWYVGANVRGKPRVFMPYIAGLGAYRAICDEVIADGYRGFRLSRPSPRGDARRLPAAAQSPAPSAEAA